MKPVTSISIIALAAQSLAAVPVSAAPRHVLPEMAPTFGTVYQIDCHDLESESEPGYFNGAAPEFFSKLGDLNGGARLYLSDCDNSTPEKKKASVRETRKVTRNIESVNDRCDEVPTRLKIDCIAQRYEILAQSPELSGEYDNVRKALKSAAKQLCEVAENASDPAAPKERLTVERNGSTKAVGRPLTPVAAEKQEEAFAAAIKIIEETETLLLRSAGTSKRRQVSYQRIAQAMDSNKVLLRS